MNDFTDRTQFRIGDLLVIPARLIVARDGKEIKFEPRWMGVLVMLAEHAGETLNTERLLIDVWGSAVYGDSPVSKAISFIRKSIGDDHRKPRYIETVNKVGYRVIAPVSLPENYRRTPSERWAEGSPYVGLSAFDADHASVFCGRSRVVADLLRAMRVQIENQRRLVLIVGASGCGKTSLLRAGAIPLLTKPDGFDGLRALAVATCDLAASGRDPLIPLTAALATWTLDDRPVFPPLTLEQLKALLTETPEMIEGIVSEAFRRHSERNMAEQPYAHLLLSIDHAEALVATTEIDTHARDAFARVVQALCDCPHVMVTMIARGDFYLKLIEALPVLAEYKAGDGHLDVMAPRYGEIGEIIRSPAWKADLSFDTDPVTRTRLDDALRDAALSQPDALPLLQHTLQTLYERRNEQRQLTFAAYNDIGGLEGAIAHRAEEVFATLPANVQASLDAVLMRLIIIQPDSDAVNGRPTFTFDLSENATSFISAFITARLFVSDQSDGRPMVGVAHEALLRRWPRAVEWAQENRQLLMAKTRFQRAAARWVEDGRQDDHLLNAGRPLGESQEVAQRLPDEINIEMRDLLRASNRQFKRKRNLRRWAISSMALLTTISTTLAITTIKARNEADIRQEKERRLMTYMLGPLADELRMLGKLDLLASIGSETLTPIDSNFDGMSDAEIVNAARAARSLGEALHGSGDRKTALSYFNRARAAAEFVLKRSPDLQAALFEQGNASYWLGYHDYENREYSKAEKHWDDYLRDSRRLVSLSKRNPEWVREESYAINNLGVLELRKGSPERALTLFKISTRMKERAAALSNNDPEYKFDHIDSLSWISSTQQTLGQLSTAASGYDQQIAMLNDLIENRKDPNLWKLRLANYLQISANLESSLGHMKKAQSLIEKSIRTLNEIRAIAPGNNEWADNLTRAHIMAATVNRLQGDSASERSSLNIADSIIRDLPLEKRSTFSWRLLDAYVRFAINDGVDESHVAARQQSLNDAQLLASYSEGDEAILEYARMLVEEGKRSSLDSLQKAHGEWSLARSSLEKATGKTEVQWLHLWIETNVLLGNPNEARKPSQLLSSAEYRHPEYIRLVTENNNLVQSNNEMSLQSDADLHPIEPLIGEKIHAR